MPLLVEDLSRLRDGTKLTLANHLERIEAQAEYRQLKY